MTAPTGIEVPEEAVEAAVATWREEGRRDLHSPETAEQAVSKVERRFRKSIAAALPAIEAAVREGISNELEAMIKRQEIDSRDTGWVVPVTSLEAFAEIELEADRV